MNNTLSIFLIVWAAFIAMSFWESSAEGRKAWDKGKIGWKIHLNGYVFITRYHFWVWIMWLLTLSVPFAITGWDLRLFGILLSALFSGFVIEDFFWYILNPKVKLKEFYSPFSNYYPWIKIGKQKIIPIGYIAGILAAVVSWLLLWK
ncbi:MAG: hypothetical protein ABH864_05385 [archaeon]